MAKAAARDIAEAMAQRKAWEVVCFVFFFLWGGGGGLGGCFFFFF